MEEKEKKNNNIFLLFSPYRLKNKRKSFLKKKLFDKKFFTLSFKRKSQSKHVKVTLSLAMIRVLW